MGKRNASKKKQKNSDTVKTLKGKLDITRSGMGFVIVPEQETDVLIRPSDFNTAMHGDIVKVKIKNGFGRRMQGEVMEVVERKRTEFIGHIEMNKDFAFFVTDTDKPMPDIFIPLNSISNAKDKDRVVVKMLRWEKGDKRPVGEVISVLDAENSNDAAMKEILLENGFPLEFPDDALEVAARIPDAIGREEIK